MPVPVPKTLPADQLRAWTDLVDAIGHHVPLLPRDVFYLEVLSSALACARRPGPETFVADQRRLVATELAKCGVEPSVIARLAGGGA